MISEKVYINYQIVLFLSVFFAISTNAWSQEQEKFLLPPAHNFFDQDTSELQFQKELQGIPLSLDGISTIRIDQRNVIYIPVLMNEPELPIEKMEALTIDPLNWENQEIFTEKLGRRSLYFMDIGGSMLYGVAIDPIQLSLNQHEIGVGLIVVKRIDENIYDVLIQNNNRTVLAAGRGKIKKIDPSIGMGTLIPLSGQGEIRKKYNAEWKLDPNSHTYPLMTSSEN